MKPKLVAFSEEVVRWGFEIRVNSNTSWFLAFTNPTAGPWKRVMAPSQTGRLGEVYRFAVNEPRPDLILVSDTHRRVVIVEAKTNISQLSNANQRSKTASMFIDLKTQLVSLTSNEYWKARCNYAFHLGLLWGPSTVDDHELSSLIRSYSAEISEAKESILCISGGIIENQLSYNTFQGIRMRRPDWFTF